MQEIRTLHHLLGRGDIEIDPISFGAKYRPVERNPVGIPMAHVSSAIQVGEMIANCYETKYDQVKAFYISKGENWHGLGRQSDGSIIALNFCATAASCDVARLLDRNELLPYAVLGLHALLADQNHFWVFSHLCEAVHMVDNDPRLSEQLGEDLVDLLDDVRTAASEAIYQYCNHLALTRPNVLSQ